jgi:hypothetical protein
LLPAQLKMAQMLTQLTRLIRIPSSIRTQ